MIDSAESYLKWKTLDDTQDVSCKGHVHVIHIDTAILE